MEAVAAAASGGGSSLSMFALDFGFVTVSLGDLNSPSWAYVELSDFYLRSRPSDSWAAAVSVPKCDLDSARVNLLSV